MRFSLLFLVQFVFFFLSGQQAGLRFFDKGIYKVWYSEEFKNPVKVQYSVFHYKDHPEVSRKNLNFYSEKGIKTASTKDFIKNDYDKGHLCPAETFSSSKELMKLTFSYLNCSVQHYELNRGLWNKLEHMERKWSENDSLIITVELQFDEPPKKLPTGASIPKAFKKSILFYYGKKTEVYLFPNSECRETISNYKLN
jgi:DNA/RNA endonuclease G (NUC1)